MAHARVERLRTKLSGVNGRVREAGQQSIARILVGVDGSLTIEAKPGGPLGVEGSLGELGSGEEPILIEQDAPYAAVRQWKLITAP